MPRSGVASRARRPVPPRLVTGSITISILTFAISTVLLLLVARPPLKHYMQRSLPESAMHTEALVGRTAEVVAAVDAESGRIRLAGELWSARLESSEPALAVGLPVQVVRIDGATAVVRYHRLEALAGD